MSRSFVSYNQTKKFQENYSIGIIRMTVKPFFTFSRWLSRKYKETNNSFMTKVPII